MEATEAEDKRKAERCLLRYFEVSAVNPGLHASRQWSSVQRVRARVCVCVRERDRYPRRGRRRHRAQSSWPGKPLACLSAVCTLVSYSRIWLAAAFRLSLAACGLSMQFHADCPSPPARQDTDALWPAIRPRRRRTRKEKNAPTSGWRFCDLGGWCTRCCVVWPESSEKTHSDGGGGGDLWSCSSTQTTHAVPCGDLKGVGGGKSGWGLCDVLAVLLLTPFTVVAVVVFVRTVLGA